MNVPNDELNEWERGAVRVNGRLLRATDALRRGDLQAAETAIGEARERNWQTRRELLRAGAVDSIRAAAAATMPAGARGPSEPSLAALTSSTNRRFLELLRELHEVAILRDRERGIEGDGIAEGIGDMLAEVGIEVHGPAGLEG